MAGGGVMLIQAVETYLAVRRAADFKLDAVERYLRSFAQFATAQGDTHVVTHTAIAWAEQGASEPQRHNRLSVVVRFARFSHAEASRHEVPPGRLYYGQRRRRVPYLFREEDLQALLAQATRLVAPSYLPHPPGLVGRDGTADLRSARAPVQGRHPGWPGDSRNEVPEEPSSALACDGDLGVAGVLGQTVCPCAGR